GGESVLMYKIIDWWEDCSSNRKQIFHMKPDSFETQQAFEQRKKKAFEQYKDCDRLKGKNLKYSISSDVQIVYEKKNQELRMMFDEEIASLIDLNSQNLNDSGSLVFKCIRLNEKTFSTSDIFNCGYAKIDKNTFVFMNISSKDALKIKKNCPEISAVIKGNIGSMENSRIIFQDPVKSSEYPPVSISLYHINDGKVFMEYVLDSKRLD
ncbi:hypothetical protein QUF70_14745, partial [Desulfobacterales bacterium HSG17]|nr:hypothetical protein [Desulfobacterales bacterium HSG17]